MIYVSTQKNADAKTQPAEVPGARAERQGRRDGERDAELREVKQLHQFDCDNLTGGGNAPRPVFGETNHAYRFDIDRAALRRSHAPPTPPRPVPSRTSTSISFPASPSEREHDTGPVSAHFAVEVKNKLAEPLSCAAWRCSRSAAARTRCRPYSQGFNETIAPEETKRVSFWAPAFVAMRHGRPARTAR